MVHGSWLKGGGGVGGGVGGWVGGGWGGAPWDTGRTPAMGLEQ